MTFYPELLIILLSYLVGSVSGGIIIGKIKKIDIRKEGSKSSGATNAVRTMGVIFGLIVFFIDVYKGYFAVQYIPALFLDNTDINSQIRLLAALASILGHVYPLFFKFKGGKGVGTALGTLIAMFNPLYPIIAFEIWLIMLMLSGYVGLSSIIAGISVPITHNLLAIDNVNDLYLQLFGILIGLFFIFTHRENIKRMLKKEEPQFKKIMLFKSSKQ